jgi:hypothetical protein
MGTKTGCQCPDSFFINGLRRITPNAPGFCGNCLKDEIPQVSKVPEPVNVKVDEEALLAQFIRDFPVILARDLLCRKCCKLMKPRYSIDYSFIHDAMIGRIDIDCHGRSTYCLVHTHRVNEVNTSSLMEILRQGLNGPE